MGRSPAPEFTRERGTQPGGDGVQCGEWSGCWTIGNLPEGTFNLASLLRKGRNGR